MMDPDAIPDHWAEIPKDIRMAIVQQAKDRLWWNGFKDRLNRAGKWASPLVVLVGAFLLFRDQFVAAAAWIAGSGK
jgi:hypothetical protein